MTPAARLVTAGAGAIAGSAIAVAGARVAWETFECLAREVNVPGLGTTRIPGNRASSDASDIAPVVGGLTLLALVAAVLVFLAGPRGRLALLAASAGATTWSVVVASTARRDPFEACGPFVAGPIVTQGWGRWLTVAGGILVLLSSIAALPTASKVPRFRLPESGPQEHVGEAPGS